MLQLKAKILSNQKIKGNYFHCIIEAPGLAKKCVPGGFIQVRVKDALEPLLRRPFSVHRADGKTVEIMYELLGPATKILAREKRGEYLDIIGPLGNGFDYQLPFANRRLPILVAGGMGVAPLVFLAEKLTQRTTQDAQRKTLVLIGGRTKNHILCEKEFKYSGCSVKIATDDGSAGFKGRVTVLLEQILRTTHNARRTTLYACGPRPMLREITRLSQKYNIPAQISLEEHMSCGIGACMGCVVETKAGYKRVCQEGPVFDARQIVW